MDERQLKALREMLDEVYLGVQKAHADGTIPCDLTLIFAAIASHTVKFENIDKRITYVDNELQDIKSEMTNMDGKLDKIANSHAFAAGQKQGVIAIIGAATGGAGIMIIQWIRGLL